MSGVEVRARISQEVSKRLDFALYTTGLGPRVPLLKPHSSATPKFFFGNGKDHDGPALRATLLREQLPQEAESIIHDADSICRHGFHLLGYETIDYGPIIDWHRDPVHGKHTPSKPWFKINFLDFREAGDHKIIWELNRHQHLVTLAKAWCLTGDQVYTRELACQWYSWQKENPYPLGINWSSALEAAFRSLSWLWIRNLLAGCPGLPAAFQTDLLLALQMHGWYIERYLSTYFSPNTHLLGEGVALFFVGTLCPEIAAAERWRDRGWRIVLEESERQVRPDGLHFEQALYYHIYALDFFLHARILAGKNGFAVSEPLDIVLKKMLDVVQALSAAGPPEGFGDDDGGRVFNPKRNHVEHMTDPLALGAILYECDKYATTGLTEEAIWLFGDRAIEKLGKPNRQPSSPSKAFAAGGIYLINDNEACAQQLMIDAGPQGTGRSGHGHADALSIRLSLDGQRFLVDPGTYCYISDDDERNRFRGTGAHNTLRADSLDQAVPEGPFAWSSIPNVTAETWLNGDTFDFFVGSHDGYRRLPDPVLHRRQVFHVKGGLWFVRDVAEGRGNHLLESFWHFAPDLSVKEESGIILALPPASEKNLRRSGLAILTDRKSAWTAEITGGFVSPAYGSKQVAPVVRFSANVRLPQDCAVLLLPRTETSDIGAFTSIGDSSIQGVHAYRYKTVRNTEFLFLAPGNRPWECGPWTSDAALLYCRLNGSRLAHVIMVSGSFAEWRGKRFALHSSPDAGFEWLNHPLTKARSLDGDQAKHGVVSEFEFVDSAV
jgi:hypothetical protein